MRCQCGFCDIDTKMVTCPCPIRCWYYKRGIVRNPWLQPWVATKCILSAKKYVHFAVGTFLPTVILPTVKFTHRANQMLGRESESGILSPSSYNGTCTFNSLYRGGGFQLVTCNLLPHACRWRWNNRVWTHTWRATSQHEFSKLVKAWDLAGRCAHIRLLTLPFSHIRDCIIHPLPLESSGLVDRSVWLLIRWSRGAGTVGAFCLTPLLKPTAEKFRALGGRMPASFMLRLCRGHISMRRLLHPICFVVYF